jgi:hypothetical protein
MLPPRCLDAALKTRWASSRRTWRPLIRLEANREDAFTDMLHKPPLCQDEVFACWLSALQSYTIDFDPAPRASLNLSLAVPKDNRRARYTLTNTGQAAAPTTTEKSATSHATTRFVGTS